MGHTHAREIDKCVEQCRPTAKLISVRHPLTFYTSAYGEYVTSRPHVKQILFAEYMHLVFNQTVATTGAGVQYSTLTERLRRTCGELERCSEFVVLREEHLFYDLNAVLQNIGLEPVVAQSTHTGKRLAVDSAVSKYTCDMLWQVAAMDKWVFQTYNYHDFTERCPQRATRQDNMSLKGALR